MSLIIASAGIASAGDASALWNQNCASCHGGDPTADVGHEFVKEWPEKGRDKNRSWVVQFCARCHSDPTFMLVFLDSNLHIAKWIYGDNYTGSEIDAALRVAAGESDWIGRHSDVLYALLLFSATLCCVALSYYLLQLVVLRRARRVSAGNPSL